MKGTVLVTRPEEDGATITKLLTQKDYTAVSVPFLKTIIHKEPLDDLSQYEGLVFTSPNGVRSFCQNAPERNLPVWAVGDQTMLVAKKNGFSNVISAQGNVQDLTLLLNKKAKNQALLYIRGEHISQPLQSVQITEKTLYHTEKIKEISKKQIQNLIDGNFSHALFFSKRTAESFIDFIQGYEYTAELKNGLRTTQALCLGDAMLECLSVLPWQEIKAATVPNKESLLALLD